MGPRCGALAVVIRRFKGHFPGRPKPGSAGRSIDFPKKGFWVQTFLQA